MKTKPISGLLASVSFLIASAAICNAQFSPDLVPEPTVTNIYKNDFKGAIEIDRWSPIQFTDTLDGRKLPTFGRETKFDQNNLPQHQFIRMRIQLVVMGTHDGSDPEHGPDHFSIGVEGGSTLMVTNFRNPAPTDTGNGDPGQAFPDNVPTAVHKAETGATIKVDPVTQKGALGLHLASLYEFELAFPHSSESLTLEFFNNPHDHQEEEKFVLSSMQLDAISGPVPRTQAQFADLLGTLQAEDPVKAQKALIELIASGGAGADYVRVNFEAAKAAEEQRNKAALKVLAVEIEKWIGLVTADEFRERVKARAGLKQLHPDAIPLLEKKLGASTDPGERTALASVIKSLRAKLAPGVHNQQQRLVAARIGEVLRHWDIHKSGRRITASRGWFPLGGLDDGYFPFPEAMNGIELPSFLWRVDEGGLDEWVQYEFPEARQFDSADVFWSQNSSWSKGAKLPERWSLVYLDGEAWKPVKAKGEYTVTFGKLERVEFEPVMTTSIRLQCKAQPNHYAGLTEFRLGEVKKKDTPKGEAAGEQKAP